MIRIVLLIGATVALLVLLRLLVLGSGPRHSGLSPAELHRYSGYLSRALREGGRVEVGSRRLAGVLILQRQRSRGSPSSLVMRFRRASFGRRWLVAVIAALTEAAIPHTVERSRGLRRLREIRVPIDAAAPRVINSGGTPVVDVLHAMGLSARDRLTVTCRGPFRPGFEPEDGEILPRPLSYRVGVVIGWLAAAIASLLRGRGGR